jgi:hypothetical protein
MIQEWLPSKSAGKKHGLLIFLCELRIKLSNKCSTCITVVIVAHITKEFRVFYKT